MTFSDHCSLTICRDLYLFSFAIKRNVFFKYLFINSWTYINTLHENIFEFGHKKYDLLLIYIYYFDINMI